MAGVPIHVSLQGNLVIPTLPPLMSVHDFAPIPPAVVPPPSPAMPALEPPVPVMWAPGFGLQQNKLTTTVFHKFQWMMLDGHDCGHMIPHVSIPVTNLKTPLHIMFSSRKVMFSASTVKANGTPVGCAQLLLFPMMTCMQPVSAPTSFPAMNLLNSVTVGMTVGDIIAGWIGIACSVIADVIVGALGNWKPTPLAEDVLGRVLGAGSWKEFAVKTAFGVVAGAAKIFLTGEGAIQIAGGSGWAGVQVTYTRTEGANQFGVQGQLAPVPGVPATVSVAYQYTSKPDGTSTSQTTEVGATPATQVTHQSTTTRDGAGHVTQETDQTTETGGVVSNVGTAEGTHTSTTTTTPGQAPTTDGGSAGAVSGPFGAVGQSWGAPL
jgi:hypothetical protein